jgi:hypothetical protein
MNRLVTLLFFFLLAAATPGPARAQAPAVSAKQFPTGYFYRYHQAPLKEKEQILGRIEATLKKLNREKLGLIAKGAVIEKLGPDQKAYDRLTILDESGLIIIARNVPNLYYQYAGPAPLNPNIYLVIKNARVDFPESYIRYGFVVEGDYVAYAHKFVTAILENLEAAAAREEEPPARKAK